MDLELEKFKTEIPLPAYARSLGYVLDRRESSARSVVMRHPNGNKIIVSRKPDQHYTYWSVRDDRDKGTIIDLLKNHKGLNLGEIRKELRAWIGGGAIVLSDLPELSTITKDRQAVQERFRSMQVAHHHPYLEEERAIPASVLQHWRFRERIKMDSRQNVAFAHADAEGFCGYELRNRNFKGYAPGGTKGLFLSEGIPEDNRLVIGESALDILSYAVLFPDGRTRYASVGGKPSLAQVELLKAEIKRMPEKSEIVAAMDNDRAGRQLVTVVSKAFDEVRRDGQTFRDDIPVSVKDWNEALQAIRRPSGISACQVPCGLGNGE